MTVRATRSLRARLALTTALAGLLVLPGVAAGQLAVGVVGSTNNSADGTAPTIPLMSTLVNVGPPLTTTTTIGLNAKNTVINWTNLSVQKNAAVDQTLTFNNATANTSVAVLNRVATGTTTLSGTLNTTNGVEVWISNPNGIIIGSGANINTNGLVLTTLDVAEADFIGSAASYHLANSTSGNITTSGTTLSTINTNNGKLLLIAPAVQLTNAAATYNAGTGAAGFVTATDVTLSAPGSPLGITVNAGTAVASPMIAQQVAGSVSAGQAYFLMTAQDTVNALLEIDASVTATAAGGVVILAGPGLTQGAASTGSGAGGGTIATTAPGALTATNLSAFGNGGISLTNAANAIGTTTALASSGGAVSLTDGAALTVAGTGASGTGVTINVPTNMLTISAPVTATTGMTSLSGMGGITLNTNGNVSGGTSTMLTGAVTLGDDVMVSATAAGGTVNFANAVSGNHALTVAASGTKTFSSTVGAGGGANVLTSLTSTGTGTGTGTTAFGAGATSVTTSGNQSYGDVSLGADMVFTGVDGTFNGTVTGNTHALDLKFSGATTLNAVGGVTTFTTESGGTTTLNGNVTTTGVQTYTDDVALNGTVIVDAGASNIAFNGALNSTTGNSFGLTANSTGATSFGTVGGATALASLTTNAGGTTTLNGNVTTDGAQTYNDAVTTTPTVLQTLKSNNNAAIQFNSTLSGTTASTQSLLISTTGTTTFGGTVGGTRFASLEVGGAAAIGADVTADNLTFDGAVTLSNGTRTLTDAAGGTTTFNSTVGAATATDSLVLAGGPAVAKMGLGTGAGVNALGSLNAGVLDLTGDVKTNTVQAYTGTLTVRGDATLTGTTGSFAGTNKVVPAGTAGTLTLDFSNAQTLDGGTFGAPGNLFAGLVIGPVGSAAAAKTLTGTFAATNLVTFNDATTLGGNVIVNVSSGTGSVNVNGALNATTAGAQGLTVNTPGTTNFAGMIGGTAALGTLTTDTGGSTTISADVTANTQAYNDAVTVNGAARLLTAATDMQFVKGLTGTGTALTLSGAGTKGFQSTGGVVTLGSLTTNGGALTIAGGGVTTSLTGVQQYNNSGIVLGSATVLTGIGTGANFNAAAIAGGGNALTLDFSGTKALNGTTATGIGTLVTQGAGTTTLSNTLATSGTQTYNDAILLGTATTGVSAGANAIMFNATVDATTAATQGLSVTTSGLTTFAGLVGNGALLSTLTTTSGPVAINTMSIKTSGNQNYGGAVTLGADVVLMAGTTTPMAIGGVTFAGGVNGNSSMTDHDLTLTTTGAKTIDGTFVGIRNLTANGGGAITLSPSAAGITTSGTQTYSDPTTLGTATKLVSTGAGVGTADITFGNILNGAQALIVNTPGTTAFNGVVSGLTSITTDAAGATSIGANVTTTGTQQYNDPVTLTAATTLNAGAATIAFGSTVGGAYALTLSSNTTATAGLGDGTTALGALTANGSLTLNNATTNNVTTSTAGGNTGVQTYNGITTITGNSTLSGVSATFGGGAYSVRPAVSGSGNLMLNFTGAQTLAGGVFTDGTNKFASLTVGPVGGTMGATTTLSGGFVTGTTFTLNNVATLGGDTSVTTGTAAFNSTIDATTNGVQGLTVTAPTKTTFAANVGSTAPLASLTVNGPLTLGTVSNVTIKTVNAGATTGNQTYNGAVTLGSGVTLDAGGSLITFASTVDGNQNLDVRSNGTKTFNGNVGATVALATLNTRNSNNGNSGATVFGVSAGVVRTNGFQNYTSGVTVNAPSTVFSSINTPVAPITFVTTLDGVSTGQAVTVSSAGLKTFGGAVGGTLAGTPTLGSLLSSGTGTTQINGASVYTSGTQEYAAAVTLNADVTVKSNNSGTSALKFDSTVDSASTTARALTITTPGRTTFTGAVGGTNQLASLITSSGPVLVNGGLVSTTGAQTYGGAVTLGASTTFIGNPVNFNGGLVGGSGGPGDYDLTLTEAVAKTVDGAQITGVRNLLVNGGGATTLRNTITTSGNQTYSDAVTLATGSTTTVTTASTGSAGVGSAILFSNSVDATTAGGQGLTVNTGGTTTFAQAVGATFALANLTTDMAGATAINGGSVKTTGNQTYNDAVTLGTNTVLTSTSGSGTVALASTVDALSGGGQTLTVNNSAATIFGGAVGGTPTGTTQLGSLTTDTGGTTRINGGSITTINAQTYGDPVTLGASAILTSTAAGAIGFTGTVVGATQGGQALTVNTGGATSFGGAVGGATTGAGANTQALAALTTDAGGSTAINGGSVYTTGAQTFGDQVTLGAATTLTGTTGVFAAGLVGNGNNLTLNFSGTSALDGTITGVNNLTTDAAGTTILSGALTTSGSQTYNDKVTLGGATTLASSGNATIQFANTVDGAQALAVNTGGTTILGMAVGGTTPLASLATGTTGTTALNGGLVQTSGSQSYGNAVTLGAAATLTSTGAGTIAFAKTVDGAQTLAVNTAGQTVFNGAVGGTTALTSVTTDTPGTALLNGGTVKTSGGQTYGDAVTLGVDTRLTSTGNGTLAFGGTVDGNQLLSFATGGLVQLGGVLGATTPINGLAVRAGSFSAVTGNRVGTVAASVAGGFAYDDAAALTIGTVDGLAGIATGTAATTVSAGGLLTLATNVAAGNTSLTGVGVTQNAGTSVNAGAGTILLDANDGAFALAGTLTTTNATANAVLLRDSAAATLGTIVTGTGGTTTLGASGGDNLGGNVTQTAGTTITTGTLNGSVGGTATLTNAGNNIATLGAFSANGLSLRDSRAGLTVAGPVNAGAGNLALTLDSGTLALAGTLTATTGTVTLTSGGAISQSGGGIVADTLTGSSTGGTSLTSAGNMIAKLAGFTNNGSGGFALNDGRALTVTADATTAGDLTINAVGIDFTGRTVSATGAVTLGGGTGAVTGATATAATNLTVTGGSIGITTATANNGALSLTSGGAISGTTATGGTTATVSGASVNLGTVAANNGALALTATGAGGLTVGTASSTGGASTLNSQGALAVTNSLTSGTSATLTATGAATLAQTTAGSTLAVTANGISTSGLSKAGTTATFTSGGAINAAAVQSGTDASFDANGTATLAAVTAGSASGITVRALDATIAGALTASKVSFVNRSPTSVTFKLGDNTSAGGFQLSQAEINQVNAGTLTFDGGAGNVELGTLAFANAAGSTNVAVLATGRINVKGAVSGTGSGRLFRFGGSAATVSDKASVIEVTASANTAATGSGSLAVGTADLELRGAKIGVGQAPGFLTPIGFDSGATGLSVGTVSTAYVANANSSLYNSTYGGGAYQPTGATLVSAHTLTVRYTDYALFQNTGAVGNNAGVMLGGTPSAPAMNALSINADGGNNAFALFGTINGVSGSGTALLGAQVISFSGANIANTRVNGCLVGSGAGCLSSVVSQPVLNVFDSSRLNVFRSADDLAVPFDPVVGNNNEALFSGASVIDAPVTGTECAGSDDPACKQQPDKKAPQGTEDKKGK